MSIVPRPVLAFAIMLCPIATCVASAPAHVQETEAPRAWEQPACSAGQLRCTPSSGEKFHLFLGRGYSPNTYATAGLSAGFSQLRKDKYGPGFKGFGQRYGANLADGETHAFFQTFFYSWIFRQDPRYHRVAEGSFTHRSLYAVSRLFVGRTDGGRDAVNAPELLGTLTTSAMGNLYYPESDRGLSRTLIRAASMMGSRAGLFALHEFLPDIKRKLRRHSNPADRPIGH